MSHPAAPADDLALALSAMLRSALEAFPQLVLDSDQLAARLAQVLSARLAEAAGAAGVSAADLARSLAAPPLPGAAKAGSPETLILATLNRHPSGRSPGVTPESLATLTGLPPGVLGASVSALVQAGALVRDAWLVRLPQAEDLLPGSRPPGLEAETKLRQVAERRAIGDRRALGERRLYDRRAEE